MTTKYPNNIDTNTEIPLSTDNVTPVRAVVTNTLRGAILAIESELGMQPSGTFSTVRARLDALEALIRVMTGDVVNLVPTLDEVLNQGNSTEGINIFLNNGSDLLLASGSVIRSETSTVVIDDSLDVSNNKVINVATPTVGTDAANKDYVDDAVGSGGGGDVITLTGASNDLALNHASNYLRINHSSATSLNVPPNSSVAFDVGTVITGVQVGAGQVTIVAGIGVTINTAETLKLRKIYSAFALKQVSTNVWDLTGDLELV